MSEPASPQKHVNSAARAQHLISLAFFISGVAGLILELIWTRLLHLAFGANAPAVSTVLAVYMGGMALGAWGVTRWAKLRRRPFFYYAWFEVLIALMALLLPSAIEMAAPVHRALADLLGPSESLLPLLLLRALIIGSLLLVPTAAMGATLPLLAQGAQRGAAVERVGQLYAINLLGAVLGAGVVGFVLVPSLGMHLSNVSAAILDLCAAGLAALASRYIGESTTDASDNAQKETVPAAGGLHEKQRLRLRSMPRAVQTALLGLTLSGLLAMQLQVLWSRALSVVIGSSTYAFSLILVVTLAGMSAGGHWVTRRAARGGPRQALRRLAGLFMVAALGIVVGAWLVDKLPLVIRDAARMPHLSVTSLFAVELWVIGVVVFVPAFALGGILPAALQVSRRQVLQGTGKFVGKAYALNTLGAIVGSMLGGFVWIPLLGVNLGLRSTAGVYLMMALAIGLLAIPRRQGLRPAVPWLAAATVLGLLISLGSSFDVMRWSAGNFRVYLPRGDRSDAPSDDRLLFYRDGIVATVTVEDNLGSTALKVNGKVDASSQGDMPTQILSGLLPLTFVPQVPRALVIGFGSGVTVGALLAAGLPSIDLVELEPEVLHAGRLFSHVNNRPWRDPRLRLIVDDGRNFLQRGGEPYQLIVSEPSNPWMTGAASLFTDTFWSLAQTRLAEDGVFLQWVQLYELGGERIRSLIATFASVFPQVMMFSSHPGSSDTFLLGAMHPLRVDMQLARGLFAQDATRRMLQRAGVSSPVELLTLLLLDDKSVRKFVRGAPINTDDNAYVEFRAPLDLIEYAIHDADLSSFENALGQRAAILPGCVAGELQPGADFCTQQQLLAEAMLKQGALDEAKFFAESLRKACRDGPETKLAAERLQKMISVLTEADQEPVADAEVLKQGDPAYARAVVSMIDGHDSIALSDLEAVVDVDKASPPWLFLWAYLCMVNDREDDAAVLFERLMDEPAYLARTPQVYYYAARNALGRNNGALATRWARFYVEAKAVQFGR